jgi:hypothetical protein
MIPGARLEVVHGAAHGLMVEAPAAFHERLLRFYDDLATSPAPPATWPAAEATA